MKKIVAFLLTLVICVSVVPVFANSEISVYLDNEKIQFDVTPLLVSGRTLVPMRVIFEKLGAIVDWENDLQIATAKKGNTIVGITIGDTTMYKNSEPITLDVSAQLIGGRTLVPLRAVSEAFDCDVQWNGDTQTVNIYTNKSNAQIQEAVKILRNWVDVNYNKSQSGSGFVYYKGYEQVIGNSDYIFTVSDNQIRCVHFALRESFDISISLSNAQYSGMFSMDKERNVVKGKIMNSSFSNQLDLTYDSVESDYVGDQDTIFKKYNEIVEDTLILFDGFLKEKNIGLTLIDFGLDYELSEKSIQQSVAFEELRDFILYYQESKNSDKAEMVKVIENSNGSTQYSMLYDDEKDIIRLTNTRIYKGSYTCISINLTSDNQVYECSFYFAKSNSGTPDFEATYIIESKTFGENSNISFENIEGNKTNINSYKEVAKLMSLDMLSYLDWVFSLADSNEFSTNDFGFNIK